MNRKPIVNPDESFPSVYKPFLLDARLYDSSCSNAAKVFFIEKDEGFFLKKAELGSLKKEAELTAYFHQKGLGAEVLSYFSDDYDWLLTRRVAGEDCTYIKHLEDPFRLAALLGEQLRSLHETDTSNCPVKNRTEEYTALAENNFLTGVFDKSQFPDSFGFKTPEEAWNFASYNRELLKDEVLIHGDYCLPNIILNDFKFSGFIDLGNGGIGDRHIDVFWGLWSLWFNLKTDKYGEIFMDAYGRDKIDLVALKTVAAFEVFG